MSTNTFPENLICVCLATAFNDVKVTKVKSVSKFKNGNSSPGQFVTFFLHLCVFVLFVCLGKIVDEHLVFTIMSVRLCFRLFLNALSSLCDQHFSQTIVLCAM